GGRLGGRGGQDAGEDLGGGAADQGVVQLPVARPGQVEPPGDEGAPHLGRPVGGGAVALQFDRHGSVFHGGDQPKGGRPAFGRPGGGLYPPVTFGPLAGGERLA